LLLREDGDAVITIGQPSHAWLSGQLARSWGNEEFGPVEPREEVCLGAEQHDIGMAAWDLTPTRNPDTGLPRSFMEMPLGVHLELWSAGPRHLVRQSRYAALLAAMHGRRLYELRDLTRLPSGEALAIQEFIEGQRRFEEELLASLRADPASAPWAADPVVARNSQLVWKWDFVSLALCLDWAPTAAQEVPTANGSAELTLAPGDGRGKLRFDPWPFSSEPVELRCEGQRLAGRFDTDEELHDALARAPWVTVEFELVR
jgi:Protein of unknown function (DUF3891)